MGASDLGDIGVKGSLSQYSFVQALSKLLNKCAIQINNWSAAVRGHVNENT
jgi:hypothetical protein